MGRYPLRSPILRQTPLEGGEGFVKILSLCVGASETRGCCVVALRGKIVNVRARSWPSLFPSPRFWCEHIIVS